MATNASLIEVKDSRWLNGFAPIWRKENHAWWGTRSWLLKILLWTVVVDGTLAITLVSIAQGIGSGAGPQADPNQPVFLYFLYAICFPIFGVIILGQDVVIEERKMGTAAWVLSKPLSKVSFLLAKMGAHSLGILVTLVLVPGAVAYCLFGFIHKMWISLPHFLAGLGLVFLGLLFFLALSVMLGTMFRTRGPVLGISVALVLGNNLPILNKVLPTSMFLETVPGSPSIAVAAVTQQPLPTLLPLVSTAVLIFAFIIAALLRFEREEL